MRWVLFFVAALVLASVLRQVPGLGGVFHGIWGFWIAVILVSAGTTWIAARWVEHGTLARRRVELGHVENAHNQGKLGTLLLQHGRVRAALPALERAVQGEPDTAEWHYRLGSALAANGEHARAAGELEAALRLAPQHAFGDVAIELALARKALGDFAGALEALEVRDREHGETVRSAYLRGAVLARLGRREESQAAYREVGELARRSPRFSRKGTLRWRLLAALARLR